MIRYTFKRLFRQPLPPLGLLIFSAILTVTLCTLHQSNLEAQTHYEEIYRQIDVTCTITNLTGTASQGLDIVNSELDIFTGYLGLDDGRFRDHLENTQIRSIQRFDFLGEQYSLNGITSPEIAPELWPDNGCSIEWLAGYDESIYSGSEPVCVVSSELYKDLGGAEIDVHFPSDPHDSYLYSEQRDFNGTLTIAGVATGIEKKAIFCPWNTLMDIWSYMGQIESAAAIHATLKYNDDLEYFRVIAEEHFPAPNPNEDYSAWGLALDIDDSQLKQADLTLQNSLKVNELSRMLVFALTAGAGFLIGFLMIRSRKREIALLRTLGTSNGQVYFSFAGEQTLCALLGAIAGGAVYRWEPLWQLAVFVSVYYIGLSIALAVFLQKNLLTEIKQED